MYPDLKVVLGRQREKFTKEEDKRLTDLVWHYGVGSWELITKFMPNRNTRQVRERYKHYLSCTMMKIPWTGEEDNLLYQKVLEFGYKWTKLTIFFPGRSDIQLKTRWAKLYGKKKITKEEIDKVTNNSNNFEFAVHDFDAENQNSGASTEFQDETEFQFFHPFWD